MAEIVFGMAIPHSGMLGKPGETWFEDGERDRAKPELWYRNKTWTFPQLAEARKDEHFHPYLALEERRARSAKCTAAIAKMRQAYIDAKVDVVVLVAKDQKEIFVDMTPSIAIYSGKEIYNGPPQRSVYAPDHAVVYPGAPDLAQHLLRALSADRFDLTDLEAWPPNTWQKNQKVVPHGYGFVYHQIMDDAPPPSVPILMNTFYPPTQPSMPRAIEFGYALVKAIKAWDSTKRVAVIASGGLSHFVCDEEFDAKILGYLAKGDLDGLAAVDDRSYQSGTSEIKLYASVLVAMAGTPMTLVDYVPCYRTEAGTGEGMAFMHWSRPQAA